MDRRSFLKMALAAPLTGRTLRLLTEDTSIEYGRVASKTVTVNAKPEFSSPVLRTIRKDTVLVLEGDVEGKSPLGNTRWLRVPEGFIHSGNIQPVAFRPQPVDHTLQAPVLGEITVPITQSYLKIEPSEIILYRLYYGTIHQVTGLVYGKRDKPWYTILDPRLDMTFFVPAEHMRLLKPEEYSPIHTDVPGSRKSIRISLAKQSLSAFEGDTEAYHCLVSAGLPQGGSNETDLSTPKGDFRVQMKTPTTHMGDGHLTKDPLAYELPGVPWVSYFETTLGIALHGAYWHNDFGRARSHGCVNLSIADALWLYRWTTPEATQAEGVTKGYGNRVRVE